MQSCPVKMVSSMWCASETSVWGWLKNHQFMVTLGIVYLVGGFNPSEKYESKSMEKMTSHI